MAATTHNPAPGTGQMTCGYFRTSSTDQMGHSTRVALRVKHEGAGPCHCWVTKKAKKLRSSTSLQVSKYFSSLEVTGGGGWRRHPAGSICGVAIRQVNQKKVIGSAGTNPHCALARKLLGRKRNATDQAALSVIGAIIFFSQRLQSLRATAFSGGFRFPARAF